MVPRNTCLLVRRPTERLNVRSSSAQGAGEARSVTPPSLKLGIYDLISLPGTWQVSAAASSQQPTLIRPGKGCQETALSPLDRQQLLP